MKWGGLIIGGLGAALQVVQQDPLCKNEWASNALGGFALLGTVYYMVNLVRWGLLRPFFAKGWKSYEDTMHAADGVQFDKQKGYKLDISSARLSPKEFNELVEVVRGTDNINRQQQDTNYIKIICKDPEKILKYWQKTKSVSVGCGSEC